jgi:release factor glutamine methyltransferase
MRRYLKHFASLVLIPFTQWYLRKERKYAYKNIRVTIKPGVFHPGLFYSTKFILSYLESQDLKRKSFLELGCGSGLISIYAAKNHASVTASDISKLATETARLNATKNNVEIRVIDSDLFTNIDKQIFEWIVINPPYYARDPKTEAEFAWNCGQNFEYFENLFQQLHHYSNSDTQLIMVLTKGCDLNSIFKIALKHHYHFNLIGEKAVLFDEKDYLYRIARKISSSQ